MKRHCQAIALGFLVAHTSLSAQESVAASAVREWYSNVTIDGHTETGASFRAFHRPDGTVTAIFDSQHKSGGTWKVVEPGYACIAWEVAAWGKNPCYTIFKDGEAWKVVRVDDPKVFVKVKRMPGNPFGM